MRVPLTSEAVRQAIAEFDQLRRETFLRTYGFGTAKDYMLLVDGNEYDSKAVVAVAHKYLPGDGRPLKHDELSGGVGDAVRKLIDLNFVVERRSARIDWTWDEHVLALDLYMGNPASPPSKTSAQVVALSQLLQHLGDRRGIDRGETYRNANGVYMKMMNFRRFDPTFQAAGKSGLAQGNRLEEEVWNTFALDRAGLAQAAKAIRTAISDDAVTILSIDDDLETEEGGLILRLHLSRERSRKLIQRKREQVQAQLGRLACEACDFEFADRYGDLGQGFIEVHHRKPVSTLAPGDKTRLEDLALVCELPPHVTSQEVSAERRASSRPGRSLSRVSALETV
jgi:5-methylcytosine-specific restriction protein A